MIAVNKADGDNLRPRQARRFAIRRGAAHLVAALAELVAAGGDLLGAHRRRHRGAVGAHSRPSPAADRLGRACGAPRRAAGEMDVDHARRAAVRAASNRSRAQGGLAADRSRRRRRPRGARHGGRANRRPARRRDAMRVARRRLRPIPWRAVQSERAPGRGAGPQPAPGLGRHRMHRACFCHRLCGRRPRSAQRCSRPSPTSC